LDAARWQRVRKTLEQLFEETPAKRPAAIEWLCAGDSELRAEVAALLEADARGTALNAHLSRLPGALSHALDDPPQADPLVGLVIDRYRLLRRIGRGGMGSVYLAERADNQYQHHVALKLILEGKGDELARRLRNERQFLAGLDHPNIARLLDGGQVTGSDLPPAIVGRPYMVMELVEGVRIDRYADEQRLTIAERLRLFRDVCSAVQYAHRNMVMHRDLKPANIHVRDDGTVKLLDFGIAKALNPTLSSVSMRESRSDLRVFSPSYASPEQLLGNTVTEATDVYSLGVVLFRLLTGHMPHGGERDLRATITAILDDTIESPSAVTDRAAPGEGIGEARNVTAQELAARRGTSSQGLRRILHGELDAIVMRALARDPRGRYESPGTLAEDINRWLDGLPVAAFQPSAFYRLRRLVARRPIDATVSVLGCAALIASSLITAQQARVAARARDQAERKAAAAAEISEFMVGVFEGATPVNGPSITARALLDQAAEQIDEELTGFPDTRASLKEVIGRAYQSLGLYDMAKVQLEAALVLRRRNPQTIPLELAASERSLGSLLLQLGEPERAATLFEHSLAIFQQHEEPLPLEIVHGMAYLSYAEGMLGHDARAEALRRQRLEQAEVLFGGERAEVSWALNDLGQILTKIGQAVEAEPVLRRAVALRCRPDGVSRECASSLRHLADALREADHLEEAEVIAREALRITWLVLGNDHPDLGSPMDTLARVLVARGAIEEAESLATMALRVHMSGQQAGQSLTVIMHALRAEIALARGNAEEALEHLETATEMMYRVTPPAHVTRIEVRALRGRCLLALGRIDEGRVELVAAIADLRVRQSPSSLAAARPKPRSAVFDR